MPIKIKRDISYFKVRKARMAKITLTKKCRKINRPFRGRKRRDRSACPTASLRYAAGLGINKPLRGITDLLI